MAYSKTVWVNDNAPALNAANLNKIENGIYDNADAIDTINASLADISVYVVAKGKDGIWDYTKWSDKTYEAVYVGNVNMLTGSAMAGGYFHQTSSALTPPSFSSSVVSVHGAANSANLYAYVGHANDFSTYWWNSAAAALNNVPVRIMMYGTW